MKTKIFNIALIVVCSQLVIWSVAYLVAFKQPDVFSVEGKNNVSYDIVYLQNVIFDESVRPQGTYDLLSYTDYAEIHNSFSAEFSRETDISYQYTAKETLFIKHQRTADNNTNPVVFEKEIILSQLDGTASGSSVYWDGGSADSRSAAEPGGTYIIDFDDHIKIYRNFIEDRDKMVETRAFDVEQNVYFTAELLVEFTYHIRAGGLNQTFAHGIMIPISLEVFLPEFTGEGDFSASVQLGEKQTPLTTLLIIIWFAVNVFGISFGLYRQLSGAGDQRREAERILKKYPDEIILSEVPLDFSEYKIVPVADFKELLKLSVNTNRHILCYCHEDMAEFCVRVDGYAYFFATERPHSIEVKITRHAPHAPHE